MDPTATHRPKVFELKTEVKISSPPVNVKMATLGNEACDDRGGGGDGGYDVLPSSFSPPSVAN